MKKFLFIFVLAAFTLFSFNMAFARNIPGVPNELTNGSFEEGWLSWNTEDAAIKLTTPYGGVSPYDGDWMAGVAKGGSGKAYQVVDDTFSPGWNWDYNQKEVDLSAYVNVSVGSAALDLAYISIEDNSGDNAPVWNDSAWVDIGTVAESDINITSWQYIEYRDIWDFQPRWIRVSVDIGSASRPDAYAFIDDVDFESQCVPIPGAIFLLGPAFLGLIGLRRKKA